MAAPVGRWQQAWQPGPLAKLPPAPYGESGLGFPVRPPPRAARSSVGSDPRELCGSQQVALGQQQAGL